MIHHILPSSPLPSGTKLLGFPQRVPTTTVIGSSRVMASNAIKGNEIEAAYKGIKQLQKGTKGLSSSAKGLLSRRFGEREVEPHELSWFKTQKEVKYAPKNWIDEGCLTLEFPSIQDKVRELGLGYIFAKPEECNLTLVRKFYANWDTSFWERNEVKIRG
ncbi:hypothetical protein HAX54_046884 [Datura stramonium]|uniref:Uncharacterized protein n=1 Tax=Datura stramonium TaxID=4076 RepID=A0ABS8WLJ4_DATST|nr:hypothetical protein [Datura stramonium]